MNQVDTEMREAGEIKSVTPYRSQSRRPLIWLVKRLETEIESPSPISSPALGAPARELESSDSDSRSDAYRLAA